MQTLSSFASDFIVPLSIKLSIGVGSPNLARKEKRISPLNISSIAKKKPSSMWTIRYIPKKTPHH